MSAPVISKIMDKIQSRKSNKLEKGLAADLETLCKVCGEYAKDSGEHLCILPCGHRFGHVCLAAVLSRGHGCVPRCPLCRQRAHYRCGHPLLPAALPEHDKDQPLDRRAVKEVRRQLAERANDNCRFCHDFSRDYQDRATVLRKLELDGPSYLHPDNPATTGWEARRDSHSEEFDAAWQEWWEAETRKMPGPVVPNNEKVRYELRICL